MSSVPKRWVRIAIALFAAARRQVSDLLSGKTVRIPSKRMRSVDYANQARISTWHAAFPSRSLQLAEPRRFGPVTADFDQWLERDIPELGVLELRGGHVVGMNGWVVSSDGVLLPDHSWYGRHGSDMTLRKCFLERSRLAMAVNPSVGVDHLEGTVLSLASDWAWFNYGHFLLDSLSRIELFRQAGFSLDDVDHVIVPSARPEWRRFLEHLGIADRAVEVPRRRAIRADRLLVPSFPGARCSYPPFVAEFIRAEFRPEPEREPFRRLYIPRTTTRRVLNEAELTDILDQYGFEILDPAEHNDPPSQFAEASIIISAHGAALTDIVFCQSGVHVLELIPSDHVQPYWYTLANAAGLQYSYIVGPSVEERPDPEERPSPFDFSVDAGCFEQAISELVSAP